MSLRIPRDTDSKALLPVYSIVHHSRLLLMYNQYIFRTIIQQRRGARLDLNEEKSKRKDRITNDAMMFLFYGVFLLFVLRLSTPFQIKNGVIAS